MQSRRNQLVGQAQCCLDQGGESKHSSRLANLVMDRPHRTKCLLTARSEQFLDEVELLAVVCQQAVAILDLQQADAFRCDSCIRVSLMEFALRGGGDALDKGIGAVALGFGICPALQDHCRHTLNRSTGASIRRSHVADIGSRETFPAPIAVRQVNGGKDHCIT